MPKIINDKLNSHKVYLKRENQRLKRVYERECRNQEQVCNELDQKALYLDRLLARRVNLKIQQLDQLLEHRARLRSIIAQRIRELEEELQDQNGNKGDQDKNKD